ncbi:hypothetical protein PORCRE_929 [Porphyromonas crevioricanis JCM 15906]|uniref:Uncharacterized protein n=1 Tax=Porphyromonas crevioricanis JCM 15906 TaxID=1305617 RepID=T1DSE5_9PORP|nr:hypothetical protein PORCRE_929 [Porphyromonas crevioricanis JCM 15906]GAD06437.1 hypothetical protein PORCAN_33 [Porphyromonas crevioricanis JCM 13913]
MPLQTRKAVEPDNIYYNGRTKGRADKSTAPQKYKLKETRGQRIKAINGVEQ